MNVTKEDFQNTISSVQNSKNSIHADVLAKEELRNSLSNDVEAWLAQNEIKKLPMGFTNFPDGVLPKSSFSRSDSKKAEEAKKKEIEEKNKLIELERIRKEKIAKANFEKQQLKEKRKVEAKKRAEKKAELEKSRKLKAFEKKLVVFKDNDDFYRRKLVEILRKDAIARGDIEFKGKCKHHGWSMFLVGDKEPKCQQCKTKPRNERGDVYKLNMKNAELKKAAIAEGKTEYIGLCRTHGESLYKIIPSGSSRCVLCRKNSIVKLQEDRKTKTSTNYKAQLKKARLQAIAEGKNRFTFECQKCDGNEHYIKPNGYSECINCRDTRDKVNLSKKPSELKALRENWKENNLRKSLAIKNGVKRFYGVCMKHGETEYSIRGAANKHVCLLCRSEVRKRYDEKNKELFFNNENNKLVFDFLNGKPKGVSSALARHLGLSRVTVTHWVKGRSRVLDEYVLKIKEFIADYA